MDNKKYVWIVMDGGWGTNILAVFDNEKSAKDYAKKNSTTMSGFDGKYCLPITKKEVLTN